MQFEQEVCEDYMNCAKNMGETIFVGKPSKCERVLKENCKKLTKKLAFSKNSKIIKLMSVIPTIVIVEDDKDLLTYLQQLLSSKRYTVFPASTGSQALQLVEDVHPSLVLLDLTLPDIRGEIVCENIKKLFPKLPVIMVTAKDDKKDIISGFSIGADDYVTKPFDSDELLARIQAKLRQPDVQSKLTIADLVIDTDTMEVTRNGKSIPLTQTEYSLLHYFAMNPNRVLTREMILSNVWAFTPDIQTRVVDVYVGYLRKKIDRGFSTKLLHSARGFGYMLREEKKVSPTISDE
jgi:two-component system, OmpR family, response regulator ArlR